MRKLIFCLLVHTCIYALSAPKMDKRKVYPEFAVGISGVYVTIDKGKVTVQKTAKGTPAQGKFKKGDILLSVNGKSLDTDDPREVLGFALDESSGTGKLLFKTSSGTVSLNFPKSGSLSSTWPINCKKSVQIVNETAAFIVKSQQADGSYKMESRSVRDDLKGCLAGLFLLSTGEDKYLPNVKKQVYELADKALMSPSGSNWHLGYQGILLAEYYLRTGDRKVLRGLDSICRKAVSVQAAGGWGHGGLVSSPGYVQSGLMNSAGLPLITVLILAKECGIKVDPSAYQKAVKFGYRFVGHGSAPYGDHRSELWWSNTNGRNGKLACALNLLPEPKFKKAAQHLAMLVADSYVQPEFGHTGGAFNVIWRGTASSLVPSKMKNVYHRQLNHLKWYYELCRQPGGGFSMLPTPPDNRRYVGINWGTGAMGLTFTAIRRKLRINGGKPTKFSKIQATPDVEFGNAADLAFLGTDHAEGFGKEMHQPHELYEMFLGKDKNKATVEMCLKYLKHYSPLVRNWAAKTLKDKITDSNAASLKKEMTHKDPRVRRAAMNVISGYDNWGRPFRTKIASGLASSIAVSAIEKTLANPRSAWWEIDGALFALGKCAPADISRNLSTALKFCNHKDWYLRESAFWAIVGLGKEMKGKEFLTLAKVYKNSERAFVRSSYDAGFKQLIQRDKLNPGAEYEKMAVKALGYTTHSPKIAEGYAPGGALHEATHRTMMVLSKFKPQVYSHMIPDLQAYLKIWEPYYQHSVWLITGSKWQPGLIKVMNGLGKEGKPLRDGLQSVLNRYSSFDSKRNSRMTKGLKSQIEKAVKDWDNKYN